MGSHLTNSYQLLLAPTHPLAAPSTHPLSRSHFTPKPLHPFTPSPPEQGCRASLEVVSLAAHFLVVLVHEDGHMGPAARGTQRAECHLPCHPHRADSTRRDTSHAGLVKRHLASKPW